ncbi:MAG: PAS domain S-box protein [Thermodesulfobacteriota bacterium]
MDDHQRPIEDLVRELRTLRARLADGDLGHSLEGPVEEALQTSEANYRAIFNAANDAIFVHDLHTGQILDVNEKMSLMYGYAKEEALGLDVEDLSSGREPYTQAAALNWIRRAAAGEPQLFEWRARRKDRRLFWVEVNLRRARIGGENRLLAVVRDITERKNTEDALRKARLDLEQAVEERTIDLMLVNAELKREIAERKRIEQWLRDSERRYRTLMEEVPDVIFILDDEGKFTYLNCHVEQFLDRPVKDFLDTPLEIHVAPEDRDRLGALLSLEVDAVWDEEVALISGDGTLKFARIRCKALRLEPDQPIRYEGVMRDITRRRILEEELKASREELLEKIRIIDDLYAHIVETGKAKAIADHTAEVAHELRQPLTIIGGFAKRIARQLAEDHGPGRSAQVQICRMIMSEVARLEGILDRLIAFTRRGGLALQKHDPNEIIRRVLQAFAGLLEDKGLRVEAVFGDEVGEILLDPLRFEQVVRNLIANAVEASPAGHPIGIETGVSIPSGKAHEAGRLESEDFFEMKIRNPGTPIPQEDIQKLFSPFFTTKDYGTGIGLTLCKKIVEDHAGSISVQSDDEGTVFTVWLPVRDQ